MDKIHRNQNSVKNWLALIIITAGFCLAYPSTAEAAVQVDAVSSNSTSATNTITIPHTTSGTNRLMLVGVSFNNDNYETVTGVTYNSVPLTLVGTAANVDDARIEIWRLIAPDTGTHDVVVTFSAVLLQEGFAGVVTFTGVHQSTPLGTFASAAADGITATVDVSSATGELVFDTVAAEYATSATVGAGQTQRWNLYLPSSTGAGSTEPGATTVTMSWTLTAAGDHWAIGGVSVKPATTTFGDGASPANKNVAPSSTNNAVDAFTLATDSGTDTVTALTVTFTGTDVNDVAASGVKIYEDNGSTANEWDATDTLIDTASFSGTTASFTGLNISVNTTATQYLVTYDIAAGATPSNTLQGAITAATVTNTLVNNDTTDATLTVTSAGITYVRSNGSAGTSTTLDIGAAGTNRLVVVFADHESTGVNLTGATVDGKACTLVTIADNPNGAGNHLEMWYIDEDGLGASTGTVTIAISGGDATWAVHAHLYTGVDQTGFTDSGIDNTSASVTTATVTGIDVPADGLVVMGSGEGQDGLTATWTSPLVTRIQGGAADPSSADMATASGVETTQQTNKTYVCTWSGTHNRATAIVAVWSEFVPTTTIGDGTSPSNKDVERSSTNNAVDAFTLVTNTGTDTVTALTVTFTGTNVNDVTNSGVKIYEDNGSTANEWDATDTLIDSASFSGTTASFTGLNISVNTSATQYLVTYDIATGAADTNTLQGAITAATVTNTLVNNDTTDATLTISGGDMQAIKIQRGTANVPNTGTTQTAPSNFTAFGSLTSAFVLNKCNRFGSAGRSTPYATSVYVDDLSLRIELTAPDTITFTRLSTGDNADYRADWEAWEYIGSPGGANEFIVRSRNTITIAAGNRTNTEALDNTPADIDKCIPFITGISNTGTLDTSPGLTALAWISGTNTLNVERGGSTGTTVVQIVTVEFTGSNWRVGHGRTSDFILDDGTVTLYSASDGQTTPFTINDINNAIIASAQFKGDDTDGNNAIADTYPAMYISSTTQVTYDFDAGHDAVDNQIFVHVLENADMSVTRYTDTGQLEGDNNVDITTAGVTDLTNTAIFATRQSSGTGTAFPRGWENARITSTTNAALWCTRSGNTISSRVEIAIMPTDTPAEECDYSYKRSITIDNTKISGSTDFTDFPVLISLSGDWLKTTAADPTNGRIENANGYDIIFKDSTETTQLDHEIELYDGSASGGTLVAWVRIPTLDYNDDTIIYMYYGSTCPSSSTENITGVWDSDYVAVWHFKESSGTVYDSTSNDNDGSPQGTPSYVDAKVGKAYNTTNGYFSVPYSSSLDFVSGSMYIECWVKYDNFTGGTDPGIFVWNDGNTDMFGMNDPTTPRFRVSSTTLEAGTASADTWYYYVGRYNGSNMYTYHNTSPLGSVSKTGNTAFADGTNTIGYRSAYTSSINGIIDELRISKTDRGVDYMTTTYNNQNSPSTFYTVGSEESCSYSYRKAITIDNTKVSGTSDLINFPALINLSGNWLKTTTADPTNGRIENANGYDIIFKDSGGTQLDHEIEDYDGSASGGTLVAWVRIPTLDYNDDTIIYMYYGNSCIISSQENITGVWNSNYKGVWHLKEEQADVGNTGLYQDSTLENNDGDDYVSATGQDGKIDGGQQFDATDDYVDLDSHIGDYASLSEGSISIWFKYTDTSDYKILFSASCNTDDNSDLDIMYYQPDNVFMAGIREDSTNVWNCAFPANYADGGWHHYVMTVDSSGNKHYVDGSQITGDYTYGGSASTQAFFNSVTGLNTLRFGNREDFGGNQYHFGGNLDEVRISNIAFSADWIQTEYNNHNSPSTFYSEGNEEEAGDAYLAEHAAGQEADSFGSTSPVTGAELFAFKLTNEEGSQVTISEVQFQLSSVTGIAQGDFSNLAIYVDSNNDGTIGGGETTTVGGTGTVDAGVTTITFSTDFNIIASTTVNYILTGDVSNLAENDTVTIDLGTSNITLTSGTVGGTAPTSVTHTADAQCDYSSWRQITIDNTKVNGTSDLSNFPLLVSLSSDWLKTTTADPTNGRIENASGYDLIFKDSGGTQLDHEIEEYDGTNGTFVAWVRIPTLSYNTDTVIYMYYGNTCISSSQENVTGVWDSNYKAVWHLKEDPSGAPPQLMDSTLNNNDGTTGGTMISGNQVAGQINGSVDFDGTDDYATMPTTGFNTSAGTVEAWINADSFPAASGVEYIFAHRQDSPTTDRVYIQLWDNNTWGTGMGDTYDLVRGSTLGIDTWYHLVITWDGTNVRGYLNGNLDFGPTSYTGLTAVWEICVMAWSSAQEWADGTLDELRVSSTNRSADWILTEYNNQNDPSTFYSLGEEGTGCSYSHRKKITILNSQVSGTSDHSNFPALVSLTDTNLRHIDSGGHVTNINGYDIIFRASDETTQLDHEIEEYDSSAGTVVAWVRIPTLPYNTDTVIYMYYGNTCISSSQEDVTGVWVNSYRGVWHLSEAVTDEQTTGTHSDSTSNNNDGSQGRNDDTTGNIANGQVFDGTSVYDYITVPYSSSLDFGSGEDFTVSAWVNTNQGVVNDVYPEIVTKEYDGTTPRQGYSLVLNGAQWFPEWYFDVYISDTQYTAIGSSNIGDGTWHYLVGVRSGNSLITYEDGVVANTNSSASSASVSKNVPLRMAASCESSPASWSIFNGTIDEVRISNIARDADWIKTSFNNQSTPSSFYNEGTEESAGTVSLGNHNAGQETDKFGSGSSVTGAELFAFKLTNTTDSTVTVKKLLLPLSAVTGIVQGDFANLAIYVDTNNDGTKGGGETTTVGGTGVVNAGVTDITFSTDFTIPANTTVNYILVGDVSNLVMNDTVTIDLGTSNVTINAGHVGGSAPTSATHTADSACEYSSWRQITIDNTKVSGSSSATNTWQVTANERDAWDDTSSGNLNSSIFGDFQWSDAGGYQFAVTIPQGATITSAKLKVYSASHTGATGAYTARINIEDVDNALAFDGTANDIYGRSYYTTTVDWSIPAAGLDTGTWTDSPDIKDLVQHIVNRPGWSSGNYLSIAVWGVTSNGGCSEDIRDYSDDSSLAAKLEVTYQDSGGSHQNFPLLVNLSGDWLKTTTADPTNGRIENASGYDIIFKDTSGTQLDHEIEDYDGTNGTLVAWVRIPTLSYDVDTVIYIYYGNPCISSSQENASGVWDSNYKGVWHMKETPTIDSYAYDSTSNNNDSTFEASMTSGDQVSGKVDGALDFEGTDDYVDAGSGASLIIYNSDFTLEAWARLDTKGQDREIISKAGDEATVYPIELRYDVGEDNWQFNVNDGAWQYAKYTQASPVIDTWYHVVGVRDGSTIRIYINGVEGAVTDTTGALTDSSAFSLYIGRLLAPSDPRYWDGQIDEARVSNIARSADWILTSYNNQNDPSTFYSVGEEGAGCSYSHRKKITIQNSQVSGTSDHSNFPILVNLTDTNLRHIDSGGHVTSTSGYDIIFRASDEITQLDHEIEEYDGTAGTVVAWVRIPTLSYNTDTVIYMYYGNTCISASQENVTGVWDSNYVAVWHLKETGDGSLDEFIDSTSKGNHGRGGDGTPGYVPAQVTGKISYGQEFDGIDDYIGCGNDSSLNITGTAITVEAWLQMQDLIAPTWGEGVVVKGTQYGLFQDWDANYRVSFTAESTTQGWASSDGNSADTWYHMVGVYNGSNVKIYRNGTEVGSSGASGSIASSSSNVEIGMDDDPFDGLIDEARVSNIARSADWIATSYNNQSTPSSFYNEGTEESAGTVSLADHDAGQETDNFGAQASITGAELFAFKLTNTTDSTVIVKKMLFPLSAVTGIVEGDFSNVLLCVDDDSDGDIEAGETTTVGGSGSVNAGVTDITFSDNFTIPANTAVNYIVTADMSNLEGNDTITIDLGTSNITITAGHVGGTAPASATHTTDSNCIFTYRRPITIQSSQVSGTADHTDFPVLISLTGTWLRTSTADPTNGHVENANGYDIIFRDANGTAQLDHEIEDYDGSGSGGTLVAWVRVPTLKYNENTVIYMYYGNPCIDSSTENVAGVWDTNFVGVWHLKEEQSGSTADGLYQDSTSNNNDGDDRTDGTAQNGKINGGQQFTGDADADYVQVPHHSTLNLTGDMTISFWLYATENSGVFNRIVDKGYSTSYYFGGGDGTNDITFYLSNTEVFDTLDNTFTINAWHYAAVTYDSTTGDATLILDGTESGSGNYTGAITGNTDTVYISHSNATYDFAGYIDEVRISNTDRTVDWLKTEYNNQNDTSTFYNIGNEETPIPTAVDLISFTATGQDENVIVEWETAQEVDNLGFNLYRSKELGGTYSKLNRRLIPGLLSSVTGQQYTYIDKDVTRSVLYYYMLEDVDLDGTRTMHGPICVDWDGDGTPDDYIEDPDDDTDTGEEDPEVSIPDTGFDELELDLSDWTPSNIGGSASWVKLSSFKAYEQDDGVALEWETSYEINNLGFHIYRELDGKFYRITPDLVPGSVFSVGEGSELPAGQSYAYWDALSKQTGRELYWIDSIELNGGRASFGPIETEISGKPITKGHRARFKSIADYQFSKARARGKVKALREELNAAPIRERTSRAIFYEVVPDNRPSEPRLPPGEKQRALSAQPGVKIYVKEDGWYRVGEPELAAAGLTPGIDPRYLQLYADGVEQCMLVTGDEDGRFDPSDAVEFYGTGLDTPFTDAHVYWLVVGSRPGKRLDTPFTDIRIGPDKGMRIPRGLRGRGGTLSFLYSVELKERTFYFAALKSGERDNFFGSVISTDPVDQLLTLPSYAASSPRGAMLEVGLQGATDVYHQVRILLNYTDAYNVGFTGQLGGRVEIPIAQETLREGDNIVTLTAQGGSMDISLVDYVRITYWRTYTADDDELRFRASGGEWLSIGGFSSPEIRLVDITDPVRMLNVRGKVKSDGSGYAVTIKVPYGGERTLMAFTEEKIKSPAGIAANIASSWHEIGQGADVIIIGHRDLLESVRPLKERREQQGLSVVLVDVEDLYDEFNFGAKSPWALKDFLNRAYQYWATQPRYLILVGDTSYDPRNYLGYGEFDLLPTKFVDTEKLKTASDDWFVDFDDDELPEMAVGRLPAASAAEAAAVVSKIIDYEGYAGFMNEVLLVSDRNDFFNFEQASAKVAELFPGNLSVNKIFRGRSLTARDDLLDLLNQGQLLVNYFGHGSTQIWNGNILTYSDALNLTNSPNLPFFVSTTCLNGFFQDPYSESLAEGLLKAPLGGAVAVWTSSGLTNPEDQVPLNEELIQLLFNGQGLTIGEAIRRAKQVTTERDIRRTWILFGDPTLRLR